MQRRRFIQFGLLSLAAVSSLRSLAGGHQTAAIQFLSSANDPTGAHFIVAADATGLELFRIPVKERCHSGCLRPGTAEAIIMSRRPGKNLYIINMLEGKLKETVTSGTDFHFYGHGVFSQDGSRFYVTANRYADGAGFVRVYDALNSYQHLKDLPVGGMDPHELRLHPDGERLVIALGGIHTHPDYGRIKLNLETMEPALIVMQRTTGKILQRCEPSHHQLSCHHLDISAEGIVIAGYQFEGAAWETPPLIARLDTATGAFSEISLSDPEQSQLVNYTASIAISRHSAMAAVTAPKGNSVVILNYLTEEVLRVVEVPDAGGVLVEQDGSFIVSSGNGGLYRIGANDFKVRLINQHALLWDNHLTGA